MPAPPPSTGAAVSFRGAAGGIVSPSSPPPTPPPHTFAVVGNTGSATHGHEAVQHLHLRVYTNGDLLMQQPVTVAIPLVPEVFGTAASGSVMPSAAVTPSHGAADFGPSPSTSRNGAHQVPHLSLNTGDAATTATTGSDGLVDSETQQQQQQHAAHLQQQQLQQRMKQQVRGDGDDDGEQAKKLSPRSVARRMNLSVTDVVRFVRSCADRAKNLEFGYSPTDVPPASAQFPALGKSPYFYAAGDDGVSPQRRHLQELAQHAADADGSLPADAAQSSRQRDPSAFLEEIGREFRFRELFPPSDSSAKVGGPGGRGSGFTRKINASRAPSESSKHRRGKQQMNGDGSIQQQRVVFVDGVERTVSHEHLHAFFTTVVSLGNTANLFSADGVAIRSILQLKDGAMVIATSDSFVLPRVCTTIDAMTRAPPLPTASLSQSAGVNSKRLFAAPRQHVAPPPPPSAKGNREANARDVKPKPSRRAAKPVTTDTTLPWYYTSHQPPATTHDQPSHHSDNAFDERDGGGRSTSRSHSRHLPPPPQHDDVDGDDDRALQRTNRNRVPPPPPPVTATFAAAPGRRVMAPPALDTSSSSDGNDNEERVDDGVGDGRDPTVSRLEAVIAAARAKRFLWEKAPQGTTVPMPNDDHDAHYGGQSRTVSNARPQSRGMSPDRDVVFAPVAHHAGIQQPPVAVAAVAAGVAGVAGRSSPARQSKSSAQQSTTQDEPSTVTSATDAPRSGSKPKAKSGDTVNVASPTTQDGDTAPRDSKKHGSRRAASRSPKVSTRRQQQSKSSSALPTPKAPVGGDSEGNVGGGEAKNSHEHERASPASDKTASNRPFVPLQPTMEEIRHLRGGLSKDSNGSGFSGLQRSWQSPTCEDDAENAEGPFVRASPMAAGDNASRDSGGVGAGGGGKNRPPSLGDDFGSFTNTATPLGTTARTADSGMHRSTSRPLSVEAVGSPASTPHVTPPSRLRSPQYGKKKDGTGKKSPSNFDVAPEPSDSRERKAKKSKKSKKDGTARPVSPLPAHHLSASLEVDFGGSGSDNGGHRPRYISPIQRRRGESFKSPTLEDGSGSSGCPPPPPPQADTTLSNDERSGASDSSGDAQSHVTSSDEASDNDRRRAAPARNVAAVPLPEALRGAFAALGLDDTESLSLSHPRDRVHDDSPSTTPPSGQNVRGAAGTDSPGSLSAAQRERMLRRRSTPSFTYHGDPNDSRRFHPYADDEDLRDDATHTHTFPTDEQHGGGRGGDSRDPRHSPQRLDSQECDEQHGASVYSGHVKERSPAAGPQRYDDDDDDDRSLDAGLMPSDFERSHDGPSQLSSPAAQNREHLAANGQVDDHRANSRSGHRAAGDRHTPTSTTRHRQNAATISPPRETSVDDTEDHGGARHGGDPAKQSIDVTETGGVDERRSSALGGFVDLVGNSADSSCSSLSKEGAEGLTSADNNGGRNQKERGEGEKMHGSSPRRMQSSREMSPSASRNRRPLPPPPVESESSQPPSPERGTTHTAYDHRSLERDDALVGQVPEKKLQCDMAKQSDMTTPGGHHLSHSARLLPPEKLDMEADDDVQASGEDPTRGHSAADHVESNQHRVHSSADENRDITRSEIDGSPNPSPARWKSNGQPRLQSPSSRDSPPQWGHRRDAASSSHDRRRHRRHGDDLSDGDCGSDSADYEEEEEDEVQKLRPIDTLPPFPAVAECGPIEFLELTARAVDDAIATAAVRSKQSNKSGGSGDTSKNPSRRQGQNNTAADDEPTIAAPSAAAAFVRTWAQLVSGQGIPVDVVLEHAARHPFCPPDPMPPGGAYPPNGADGISQPIGQSNRRNSDGQVDDVVDGASVRRAAPLSDPLQPTVGDDLAELDDDDHSNAAIDISRDSGTRAAVQIGLQAATTKTKAAASNGAQCVKAEPDAATAASLHDESDEEIVRVNESVEGGGVERSGDVDATTTLNVSAIHGLSSDDHLSATPARPETSETSQHALRSNATQQVQALAPVQKEAPRTAAQRCVASGSATPARPQTSEMSQHALRSNVTQQVQVLAPVQKAPRMLKSTSGRGPGYHSGVVEDHPPPLLNLLFVDDIRRHCRAAFDHYSHHMHKQEWAHQADRTTVVLEPTHVSAVNMPSMSNHEGAMSLGLSPQMTAVAPTPNASNQSTVPNVETTLAGSGKGSLKLWFTGPAGSGTTTALAVLAAQSLLPQLAGDTAAARGLLTLPLNFEEVLLGAAGISGQTTAMPTHPDHVPNKDDGSDFGFGQKKKGGARASSSSLHRRKTQRRDGGESKAPAPTADVAVLFCRIMQVYVEALLGHRPEFAPVASSFGQFWKACVTQRSIPTIDITTSHQPAASTALLGRSTKRAAHARHTPASGLPSVPPEIQAALPLWRLVAMKVQRSYSRGDFVGVLGAAIHVIPETLAHTLSFGGVLFIVDGLHKCRHVQIEDWRTGLRSRTNPARVFSAALSRTRWCVGAGGAAPPSDSFVSIPMHGVISPLTAELRHRLPTELFSCGSRYPVTVFGGCPGFLAKLAVLTSLVRQSSPAALRVGSGETESAVVLDDPEIKALLDDLAAIHTPGFAHGSDCVV